jgi:hypothetical protein
MMSMPPRWRTAIAIIINAAAPRRVIDVEGIVVCFDVAISLFANYSTL